MTSRAGLEERPAQPRHRSSLHQAARLAHHGYPFGNSCL